MKGGALPLLVTFPRRRMAWGCYFHEQGRPLLTSMTAGSSSGSICIGQRFG